MPEVVFQETTIIDMPEIDYDDLITWDDVFEGLHMCWLCWCDADGNLIPTGEEGKTHAR